jgi:molybdopterin molybdotransferase
VVKVEDVEVLGDQVRVKRAVAPGTDVRRKGEDLRAGEVVLPAGTVLGPAEASALATLSRLSAPVVRRARVAILSTGDELVPPGQPLAPGKIHDSNAYALATAVAELGGEPVLLGIARDEREALAPLLAAGVEADALLTTAGVSVGDRDLVRAGLAELGVRELFWKVDVRPGSPTAFGLRGTTPVFSLPGNPVATQLMFEQLVRPALLRMMGHRGLDRPVVRAVLGEALAKKPGRTTLVRLRLTRGDGRPVAHRAGSQETGILRTSLRADGVAVLPEAATTLPAGAELDVQVLRPDWSARDDGRS